MKSTAKVIVVLAMMAGSAFGQNQEIVQHPEVAATEQTSALSTLTATESGGAIAHSPPSTVAQVEAKIKASDQRTDRLFLIIAAAMVFMMQPGFLLVELGFSRAKNALNIVMKNMIDFCVATSSYMMIGFGLMYAGGSAWVGMEFPWLATYAGNDGFWAFWLFQSTFVAATATIASGAMAERTKFTGYLAYTFVLSAIIYPVLGHWVWGSAASAFSADFGTTQGILESMGFHDFAGATVVHAVGGACALAGIIVLGPRLGRFDSNGNPALMTGHNLPLASLGVLLLWFGWMGFNGGSMLSLDGGLSMVLINTMVSAAAGGLFALVVFWCLHNRPDPGVVFNGVLGGLVAITAACDQVTPASAMMIGAIAGVISSLGADLLLKFKLDDVVGAVPVHLFNGIWGTTCVALFSVGGFSVATLGVQLIGSVSMAAVAFGAAFAAFKAIDATIGLRATDEEQECGLDFAEHSTSAYPDFAAPDFDEEGEDFFGDPDLATQPIHVNE